MPTPEELDNMESPTPDTVTEEEKKRLMDKYGATDWYMWRCNNWGCKWDAQESAFYKDGEHWMITFQTPWGPPVEFLQALSKKFNKMTFVLQFSDECMGGTPLGEATINDGSVIYDGPRDGQNNIEQFSYTVWDEEWVNDWGDEDYKYANAEEDDMQC